MNQSDTDTTDSGTNGGSQETHLFQCDIISLLVHSIRCYNSYFAKLLPSIKHCCKFRLVGCPLPGNYHRHNYGGTGSTSYGSGMTNNLGMNAGSPGLGQGSGQPIPVRRNHGPGSQNRGYPTMAPISPSMPHPVGPGMGPPSLAASNRKPQEVTVAANSTHSR